MIPDGLVSYTPSEIEEKAQQDLRKRPDVDFAPPTNVERLLISPDWELRPQHGLRSDLKIEGAVCKEPFSHRITVFVDWGVYCGPWPAYNEVLAEEYAHLRLHPALFLLVNSIDDFIALQMDPEWARFEGDARRYSAAIRMPPRLIADEASSAYARIVDDIGFGDAVAIEKRLRNRLAELFRVTSESMLRRLTTYPCDLRDRLLNSIQARSPKLLPPDWTVKPSPPLSQRNLFRPDVS